MRYTHHNMYMQAEMTACHSWFFAATRVGTSRFGDGGEARDVERGLHVATQTLKSFSAHTCNPSPQPISYIQSPWGQMGPTDIQPRSSEIRNDAKSAKQMPKHQIC